MKNPTIHLTVILSLVLLLLAACSHTKDTESGQLRVKPSAVESALYDVDPASGELRVKPEVQGIADAAQGFPYGGIAGAGLLGALALWQRIRNAKLAREREILKKTATVLTSNINTLSPTAEQKARIQREQIKAGVASEVDGILRSR